MRWFALVGFVVLGWSILVCLSRRSPAYRAVELLIPALFGLWILGLWQLIVMEFDVPSIWAVGVKELAASAVLHMSANMFAVTGWRG